MKRCCLFLLIAALLLCACGTVPPAEPAEEAGEASASAAPSSSREKLDALLRELRETVTIATAGSTLRAVTIAAKLLDWAETADISDEEILAALEPWLAPQEDGIPAEFREQLALVYSVSLLLTGEDTIQAEGLLADAGCENCGYPWSEKAIAAVERIMTLAGLQDASE